MYDPAFGDVLIRSELLEGTSDSASSLPMLRACMHVV